MPFWLAVALLVLFGPVSAFAKNIAPVRLVNGNGPYEGRVEVYHENKWGTICDYNWDIRDAKVVCRQLGLPPASLAPRNARFGQGQSSILMSDVRCSGEELHLSECPFDGWGVHNCGYYSNSAGVICGVFPVRLMGGSSTKEGRVEVYHNGTWGSVCNDYNWDIRDANVVCRQLGLPPASSAETKARYGKGSGPVLMSNVRCEGSERNLSHCPFYGKNNQICWWNNAGVICGGCNTHGGFHSTVITCNEKGLDGDNLLARITIYKCTTPMRVGITLQKGNNHTYQYQHTDNLNHTKIKLPAYFGSGIGSEMVFLDVKRNFTSETNLRLKVMLIYTSPNASFLAPMGNEKEKVLFFDDQVLVKCTIINNWNGGNGGFGVNIGSKSNLTTVGKVVLAISIISAVCFCCGCCSKLKSGTNHDANDGHGHGEVRQGAFVIARFVMVERSR